MKIIPKKIIAFFYISGLIYLIGFSPYQNISAKIFIYLDILWQISQSILTLEITLGLLILPLLFFIFALRGNIICRFLCPWGRIIANIPGNKKRHVSFKPNGYIFYFIIILLLLNINILGITDPFVFFIKTCAFFTGNISWIFIAVSTTTLLLNTYKKQLWCINICPMGFLLNTMAKYASLLKHHKTPTEQSINISRRRFLIAGASFFAAISAKKAFPFSYKAKTSPLRPPSVNKEEDFMKKCVRCGLCVSVCPTKALKPDIKNGLTPVLIPKEGYCSEFCNACTKICPTNAIKPISLAKKRTFRIGTAKINENTCLCYNDKKLCLLCVESCPYHAISTITINNVRMPVVDKSICIGCGKCENKCPINPTSAIKVFK